MLIVPFSVKMME